MPGRTVFDLAAEAEGDIGGKDDDDEADVTPTPVADEDAVSQASSLRGNQLGDTDSSASFSMAEMEASLQSIADSQEDAPREPRTSSPTRVRFEATSLYGETMYIVGPIRYMQYKEKNSFKIVTARYDMDIKITGGRMSYSSAKDL